MHVLIVERNMTVIIIFHYLLKLTNHDNTFQICPNCNISKIAPLTLITMGISKIKICIDFFENIMKFIFLAIIILKMNSDKSPSFTGTLCQFHYWNLYTSINTYFVLYELYNKSNNVPGVCKVGVQNIFVHC